MLGRGLDGADVRVHGRCVPKTINYPSSSKERQAEGCGKRACAVVRLERMAVVTVSDGRKVTMTTVANARQGVLRGTGGCGSSLPLERGGSLGI